MSEFIRLTPLDLGLAALLLLGVAVLSLLLQLRIEAKLLVAALRCTLQLALIGLVLTKLFELLSPWWTGLAALAMILFAGREIMARQEGGLQRLWAYGIGTTSMLLAASLVTVFALTTQVQPQPWYDPRYALPLLGMILGNILTGISLGLQRLTEGARQQRAGIEAQLCLGATRRSAMLPITRQALTTALMPIINSLAATGLVSLPGMMTGQILAGVDPIEAVKYQLLIMFLIAGGTTLGAVIAVFAGVYRLTDTRDRLRLDRLAER
ncbi:iron export ABC transporter permease subunit FetB [Pelagibius sp.]|uniref:ABC transporter permease n=1 Tax=Pelagibius sp. TaxID=1931238 RepID=UPI002618F6F2|nr:iron export ABC transporter permease subunit FetB [Pelagibius sp.]